jgi:hypothetical protein
MGLLPGCDRFVPGGRDFLREIVAPVGASTLGCAVSRESEARLPPLLLHRSAGLRCAELVSREARSGGQASSPTSHPASTGLSSSATGRATRPRFPRTPSYSPPSARSPRSEPHLTARCQRVNLTMPPTGLSKLEAAIQEAPSWQGHQYGQVRCLPMLETPQYFLERGQC